MSPRNWSTKQKVRVAALGMSVLAAGGAAIVAVGTTGAYFSDSKSGTISGSVGSIHVSTNGGTGTDGTNFSFDNLLPGEPQTATLNYTNTGHNAEDVWVVFPNATALSALNTLGSYGEVHVANSGNPVFDSANLNDRSSTCGAFDPTGCWPLPNKLKLASNVQPGNGGVLTFAFNFASKLKTQPAVGDTVPWNAYPVAGQVTTNSADGTGTGLPYQLVAVQHGQTP